MDSLIQQSWGGHLKKPEIEPWTKRRVAVWIVQWHIQCLFPKGLLIDMDVDVEERKWNERKVVMMFEESPSHGCTLSLFWVRRRHQTISRTFTASWGSNSWQWNCLRLLLMDGQTRCPRWLGFRVEAHKVVRTLFHPAQPDSGTPWEAWEARAFSSTRHTERMTPNTHLLRGVSPVTILKRTPSSELAA